MQRKIFVFIGVFILVSLAQEQIFCAETNPDLRNTTFDLALRQAQEKQTIEKESVTEFEVPDWVKRTNVAIEAGTDIKPKYFLETIQPLFGTQEKETVLFTQGRISGRDFRTTYNLGLGARRIFKESYLLGVNTFYDYQDLHQHHRAGVGFEVITDRGLEARLNSYLRVSDERLVKDDGVNEYYEKVANGLDWEFGLPVPYLPVLKFYGGGNWYDFEHFKNKYGWKFRAEFTPVKYSRLNFEILDDTKRDSVDYRVEGAITLGFTSFAFRDIIRDIKGVKEAYPKVDLRDRVLDRVVRDFEITVIKKTKSKSSGLTVEGGKSG